VVLVTAATLIGLAITAIASINVGFLAGAWFVGTRRDHAKDLLVSQNEDLTRKVAHQTEKLRLLYNTATLEQMCQMVQFVHDTEILTELEQQFTTEDGGQ
jgi:hypothetical protein